MKEKEQPSGVKLVELRTHVPVNIWKHLRCVAIMDDATIDEVLAKKLTEWYGGQDKKKQP